jgi:hypothetical protein
MLLILIPLISLIWLAIVALVLTTCQVAARADDQLSGWMRLGESSGPAAPSDGQGHGTREGHGHVHGHLGGGAPRRSSRLSPTL